MGPSQDCHTHALVLCLGKSLCLAFFALLLGSHPHTACGPTTGNPIPAESWSVD